MRHTTKSLLALVIVLMAGRGAYAHGPLVKVDQGMAVPGGVITVTGEGLGIEAEIKLTLQGILQDYPLGSVRGDEHGRFEMQITIPGGAEPGTYTLMAAAGSQKATAKLKIETAPAQEAAHLRPDQMAEHDEGSEGHGEHGEHEETDTGEEAHARADALEIQRSHSTLETTLTWAVILGSAMIGLALSITGRGN